MRFSKVALAVAISGIVSTNVLATNGYFSHGYGAKEKGMAGAGVAKGGNSISTANNPASLLQVGERMDWGISVFNPVRSMSVSGEPSFPEGTTPVLGLPQSGCTQPGVLPCQIPFSHNTGTNDSSSEWFPIPSFGFSAKIDDKTYWGISLYGNGGMNSDYRSGSARVLDPTSLPTGGTIVNSPGIFGAGDTGVDLMQLFVNTSIAYQASETVGLGASFIFAAQAFEANGLAPFANNSLNPNALTNNGHDTSTGFGVKLGANFDLSDQVTLGISYQSKIEMSEFDDYAGLFAENGDFDIPSSYTVGIAWETSSNSTLLLDYQAINYTDVAAISNPITPLITNCVDSLNNTLFAGSATPLPASGAGCLGGAEGAGFGWDDVSVVKLGYEWSSGDDTYRVGYSTTEQPIASSQVNFNLLAPGVVEDHFTAGYTMMRGENEWTFFIMYAPEVEVSGTSGFDPAQTISFKMHQLEFGVDFQF